MTHEHWEGMVRRAAQDGGRAAEDLAAALYEELRRIAKQQFQGERVDHTLQPTALVHEAYLRLLGDDATFDDRAHFCASAASAIRRVLVDHARGRARDKRGGGVQRVELVEDPIAAEQGDLELLALNEALEGLARVDVQKSRVVELRFFAGMTLDETAAALGVSQSSVVRDWRMARAWLQAALDGERPGGP